MTRSFRTYSAAFDAGVSAARKYAIRSARDAAMFVYVVGFGSGSAYMFEIEDLGHGGIGDPQAVAYPDGTVER